MRKYKTKQSERQRIIEYLDWCETLIVVHRDKELQLIDNGPNEYLDQYVAVIGKKQLNKLTDDEVKDILVWCKCGEKSRVRGTEILLDCTVDETWSLCVATYDIKTDEIEVTTRERDVKMKANSYSKKRAYDIWMKVLKEASK